MIMLYEDTMDMFMLYSISPELTCSCDEVHICQQCYEDEKSKTRLTSITINPPKIFLFNNKDEAHDFFNEYMFLITKETDICNLWLA